MNTGSVIKRQLPGSIQPAEHKKTTRDLAIQDAGIPDRLIIPITQPDDGPVDILVEKGQHVLKGQILARGGNYRGLAVHASSSGTVSAISEHPVPNQSNLPELCVTISTDGLDKAGAIHQTGDFKRLSRNEVLRRIRDAGITGLGGAGFPAHMKLEQNASKVHTLIINACECEPFICADEVLIRERAEEIILGVQILLQLLDVDHCLIGIEDNKPEALNTLHKAVTDPRISLHTVSSRYPSGAERQLIYLLTGEAIPGGQLPVSRGYICQNVGTVQAIARAVGFDEPLISRITTVTGAALEAPGNYEVRIGTPIRHLLDLCKVDYSRLSRLIMGGSLMGLELADADLPIIKTGNCIIATTEEELPTPPPPQACIRCGLCETACPVSLLPQQLYWFARGREHDKIENHHLFDCIECGACAWVCPSRIPLVQYFRAAKGAVRIQREQQVQAELAQRRYEHHQQRLSREAERLEQRRRQREALGKQAASSQTAKDTIQAALKRVKSKKSQQDKQDGMP